MTLKISRILHAGYVFECDGTLIAFDPIFENPFSRNCHAFPDVRFDHARIRGMRPDAVFISHFHDDHCSLESLDLLDRATPLLEQGYAAAPSAELRDQIGRTIQRIRSGETRPAVLESDLQGPRGSATVSNFELPFEIITPENDE